MSNTKSGKTILIVDDAPENISILGELLSEYNIKAALNGELAIQVLESATTKNREGAAGIDLILLDVMMPVMDGFKAAELIKSDSRFSQIPIIFVSAKTDVDSFIKGFELGAEDYIRKPFEPEQVLNLVRYTLGS